MKIAELVEWGRVVKGVNTTPDVGVNQTSIEAKKFGNKVDKDGKPPTLSNKVKGSSTNVAYNLGLTETIRKQGDKYVIYSKDGKKKLGTYNSRKAAEKRLGQIEYFKHNESKFTDMELAIMEGGHNLLEWSTDMKRNESKNVKHRAAEYLGKSIDQPLSKADQRKLQAKAEKIKTSEKKAERRRAIEIAKQAAQENNFGTTRKK